MIMISLFENEEKIYDLLEKATIALVIFLVIFSAAALYVKVPRVRDAVALATTKKPETFTELYFENHLNLPSVVNVGKKYKYTFTIHNLEYETKDYPYEIYIDTEEKKEYLEENSVTLTHDDSVTLNKAFVVTTATRSALVVNLTDKNQEIRFWMEGAK